MIVRAITAIVTIGLCIGIFAVAFLYYRDGYMAGREDAGEEGK
jgi:hypothetical protein